MVEMNCIPIDTYDYMPALLNSLKMCFPVPIFEYAGVVHDNRIFVLYVPFREIVV